MNRLLVCGICVCLGLLSATPAWSQEKSKFDTLVEKKKKLTGMWTLYQSDQQILGEFTDAMLRKEYIVIPSIARGISSGSVLGGMPLSYGDEEVIWTFRKSEEKLFINQRNVRYRAKPNSPEAAAVELAYSDSILYSLPVLTTSPSGGVLVDLTTVFFNDEMQIGPAIGPGFRIASDRSTISKLKAFEENIELQVNAVYSGSMPLDTVPNPRGVQVGVHYSISVLPPVGANGYKPRAADDRVGYFVTAVKDFSDETDPDNFVRYINRWNVQKLDPAIELSPPREPVRFYMENTVPVALRPTVEAGILEWNKAFEKLGFAGAIKVDQQPNDPNFDPENIRYNTFRWITAEAGFAMGPSRVDPRTGQILDADIIFDASFLKSWTARWETQLKPDAPAPADDKTQALMTSGFSGIPFTHSHSAYCTHCQDMQAHTGFAAAMFMATEPDSDGKPLREFIHQGLKEVVMHEVGHTLGLRHNFKASTWKTLEQINDLETGKAEGIVASVMDYNPPNISPDRSKQGLYYTQTLGPYDYWAIEYGYKPITANESAELLKIASRSNEPALAYTTDEDTRSFDPDPYSVRFDLSSDPLQYADQKMKMAIEAMPKVLERSVKPGEGYQQARRAYRILFNEYWSAANLATRFPGGISLSRDHKANKDGEETRPPMKTVAPEVQRQAMKMVNEAVFATPAINGNDLNYFPVSRWYHWGTASPFRLDYAIHDEILAQQESILGSLVSPILLSRIQDNEFKIPAGEDAYTLVEHINFIVDGLFTEWIVPPAKESYTDREPLISSFRRNLQRRAISRLSSLVTVSSGTPNDARNLSRSRLLGVRNSGKSLLEKEGLTLDTYTRTHLTECVALIDKILAAELVLPSLN